MADRREESPGKLTFQQQSEKKGETATSPLSPVEQEFWQNMIERSGSPEPLQDPVYYPAWALSRAEDFIQNGRRGPNGRLIHEDERSAIKHSIRRVKTAYQILVYPRCDDEHRAFIENDLARERNWYERDKVELTGTEAMIMTAITQTADIPSDPKRHTFLHTDIKLSHQSEPVPARTPDAPAPIPQTERPAPQTPARTIRDLQKPVPRTSPRMK